MSLLDDFLLEESISESSELEQLYRTWLLRVLTELQIMNALAVEMQRQIGELQAHHHPRLRG